MVDMGLPNGDRLSTHLLVDLAVWTSVSCACACDVLIMVPASSYCCWCLVALMFITEGKDKKAFSQRHLLPCFNYSLYNKFLFRVFYFRCPGGPQKY